MIGCVFLTIKTLEDIPFFKIPQHNQIYNKKKTIKIYQAHFLIMEEEAISDF